MRRNFTKIGDQFPKDIVAILLNNPYHRLKKNTIVAYEIVEDRFIYVMLLNCIEISDSSNFVEIDIGEVPSKTVCILYVYFFPLVKETSHDCSVDFQETDVNRVFLLKNDILSSVIGECAELTEREGTCIVTVILM